MSTDPAAAPAASADRPVRAREVVLGLGNCVDHEIVWDTEVLQHLVEVHRIGPDELDPAADLLGERDLVRSVIGFLRAGTGGERYVTDAAALTTFMARFRHRQTLGGTNVRAAIALSLLGLPSTVHLVSTDGTVRRLLPPDVEVICSAEHDAVHPHLIVQFPAGARLRVGSDWIVAPRPNRLIYVNDPLNRRLRLSERLAEALAPARLLLVSGLNSVQDPARLIEVLRDLRRHLEGLPDEALLMLEDGGYHRPELAATVREALADRLDVVSMNEDELETALDRPVDLLDAAQVAQALQDLSRLVPRASLVVHTGTWSAALCRPGGPGQDRLRRALSVATAVAGTRYRMGDAMTAGDVRRTRDSVRQQAGIALATDLESRLPGRSCCVPAHAAAAEAATTVGLGDAFVGGLVAGLVSLDPLS